MRGFGVDVAAVIAVMGAAHTPLDHFDPQHALTESSPTMSGPGMNTPLLDTIEPDEPSEVPQPQQKAATHQPLLLTPTNRASENYASTSSDAEAGAYCSWPRRIRTLLTSAWLRP